MTKRIVIAPAWGTSGGGCEPPPARLFPVESWEKEIRRVYMESSKFDLHLKLAELRRSCGVEPDPLRNGRIGIMHGWS